MVFKEDCGYISINNLMALCFIVDEYETYNREISVLMHSSNRENVSDILYSLLHDKDVKVKKKYKVFYKNNKYVLEMIDKYSDIRAFNFYNYECDGELRAGRNYFYKYLLEHRDNIADIVSLLCKLVDLGFTDIMFNNKADFTDDTFIYDRNRKYEITYLDNMVGIPCYEKEIIRYKTKDSNYLMNIRFHSDSVNKEIILNSLVFDFNRLPEVITEETIVKPILTLGEEQEHISSCIRDSIVLGVASEELLKQFDSISRKVNELENVEDKEYLVSVLRKMKKYIDILKNRSYEYDISLYDREGITSEVLENEKKLYLKKKHPKKDII